MSKGPKYAIIANNITGEQREQIQGIVKANTGTWWHAFADLWIVEGHGTAEWRDLIGLAVARKPGGVMVLKIDPSNTPRWAYRANLSDEARDWLNNNL